MTAKTHLSPVQEAEQALQVVRVLSRMEGRFESGHWEHGIRVGPTGGNCLIGAIDEAGTWTQPGVPEAVTRHLAARLPRVLHPLARLRPRLALALYNDSRGREAATRLVRRTREALGGAGPARLPTGLPARADRGSGPSDDGRAGVVEHLRPLPASPARTAYVARPGR